MNIYIYIYIYILSYANRMDLVSVDPTGRAVYGVGLRPFAW